jgi:uncharacterized membrane protein
VRPSRGSGRLRLAALVLATCGLAIAIYLTYVHYSGHPSVCGLGGDCETVQASAYSKLAGVPVAVLGLLGYLAVLLAIAARGDLARLGATTIAWVGFGFSAYLTYRELFTLDAICPWCVASAVLWTGLALLTTMRFLRAHPT